MSNGWSGYLTDGLHAAFGLNLPQALQASPFASHDPGIVNVPAMAILLALRMRSPDANVIVVFKLATVLFFIGLGIFFVRPGNWHPYFPYGVAGVGSAAAGRRSSSSRSSFDEVSTAAERPAARRAPCRSRSWPS